MILVDTGAWLALADLGDAYHVRSRIAKTLAWLNALNAQGVGVFTMTAAHLPRLGALMRQYRDLPMDLADASLVLLPAQRGSLCQGGQGV